MQISFLKKVATGLCNFIKKEHIGFCSKIYKSFKSIRFTEHLWRVNLKNGHHCAQNDNYLVRVTALENVLLVFGKS